MVLSASASMAFVVSDSASVVADGIDFEVAASGVAAADVAPCSAGWLIDDAAIAELAEVTELAGLARGVIPGPITFLLHVQTKHQRVTR
jgi:hypothetical protein